MSYALKIILAMALASELLRFLPFLIFSGDRPIPLSLVRLGKTLPAAAMGMLVIYCLKDVAWTAMPFGIPELIGCAFTVISYRLTKNNLISIFGGTLLYLVIVNFIL
ncbi:MAG: AzlD domain-containing protein [Erysipelotrichaceae bacterium]|nr:AzlD domain-containing protein [Erysipelotrichaceae bacterium]